MKIAAAARAPWQNGDGTEHEVGRGVLTAPHPSLSSPLSRHRPLVAPKSVEGGSDGGSQARAGQSALIASPLSASTRREHEKRTLPRAFYRVLIAPCKQETPQNIVAIRALFTLMSGFRISGEKLLEAPAFIKIAGQTDMLINGSAV